MYLQYTGPFARIRRHYFKKVIRQLQNQGCRRLLDYGCGPGDVLQVCQTLRLPALGIDSAPRSVALAHQRGLEVLLGDANTPALQNEKFDAVFLQSVIEHIPNASNELVKLVAMLPPGGLLFLSAPTPSAEFWDDPTHVRPFTPKSFRILAELLKLEVLEINYVFSYLLGFRLTSSWWYKFINIVPAPLGSNLVGFYRKPGNAVEG
jgi:2-polyprenyl-3-methyl-5-hydroxy-6-metoxy-1,4-benzoquinol methylase